MFVTTVEQMFKFTFKLTFTAVFLLEVIKGTFYARKSKYGMLLIQTLSFNSALEMPQGCALGWGLWSKCITDQIEHLENSF